MSKKKQSNSPYQKIKKRLEYYFRSKSYKPTTSKQIFKNLKISREDLATARDIITEFISKSLLKVQKNKLVVPEEKSEKLIGTFSRHSKGFGFVTVENSVGPDYFIPKHLTKNALTKDKVLMQPMKSTKPEKGPEGAIVEILSRKTKSFVGIICSKEKEFFFALSGKIGESKTIGVKNSKNLDLKPGDRVLLKVIEFDHKPFDVLCEADKIIGNISDASKDIEAAIYDYEIATNFPKEVLDDLEKYAENPESKDFDEREDFRDLETFTIDPDTAKDFDDALSLSKNDQGYHLIVHIADVSHYVKKDSALDREALSRCNSTYFPGKCVPMLPEKLSNGLCSLKANVPRLAASVLMSFNLKGNLTSYEIKRSIIQSDTRFTYKKAKQILDRKLESPHKETLFLMKELCLLLQKKRNERGSIDFSMNEVVLKVGKDGIPTGVEIVEYDITHQIVEEFMLKANEIVATHLTKLNIETPFRIHEKPTDSNLEAFYEMARSFGFKLNPKPKKEELQKLFTEAKNTPYMEQLCIAFIRSMKLAFYSENNVGHYGLCLEHYCHFTSPIRRYSDLIVHRQLFEEPILKEELQKLCQNLSEKERISFRAESSVLMLKKLRFLNHFLENEPGKCFEAFISKVKPFGIYFEIKLVQFEGFIHISELGNEYFHYSEKHQMLEGEKTHKRLKIGSMIKVSLSHIDLIKGKAEFKLFDKKTKK